MCVQEFSDPRLSAWIQIFHHNMENLSGSLCVALSNRQLGIAIPIGKISIPPRDFWQPGAPAADESGLFCYSEAIIK